MPVSFVSFAKYTIRGVRRNKRRKRENTKRPELVMPGPCRASPEKWLIQFRMKDAFRIDVPDKNPAVSPCIVLRRRLLKPTPVHVAQCLAALNRRDKGLTVTTISWIWLFHPASIGKKSSTLPQKLKSCQIM